MRKCFTLYCLSAILIVAACKSDNEKKMHPAYKNPAVQPYTEAIEEDPENAELYYVRAQALANVKSYALALEDVKQAIALRDREANFYIYAGELCMELDSVVQAVAYLEQAKAYKPTNEHVALALIQAYIHSGQLALADSHLVVFRNKYPGLVAVTYTDAQLAWARKDTVGAQTLLERLVLSAPNHKQALLQLGNIESYKNSKSAIAYYEQAFKVDTIDAYPLELIGDFYLKVAQEDKALELYKECLLVDHSYAYAFEKIATIYMRRGDYQRALVNYDMSTKAEPTLADGYAGKGWAFELLGKKDSAQVYYMLGLQFEKMNTRSLEGLKRLQKK